MMVLERASLSEGTRSISGMEASRPAAAPRSVAEVNGEIRDFMTARAGRPLWPEEQAQYELLLAA